MSAKAYGVKQPPRSTRFYFLDHLRTALTVLVIYTHTCVAYGGQGAWAYKSTFHPRRSLPLMAINAVAQSFYMGGFFFLSGYFSRVSLLRKTPTRFMLDKLMRLGIPAIVYTLIVYPIREAALQLILHRTTPNLIAILSSHWDGLHGIQGPVWYCALLLIFDMFYALYVHFRSTLSFTISASPTMQQNGQDKNRSFSWKSILLWLLLCSLFSFILRLYVPSVYIFKALNLRIGYVPQYIFAYIFGTQIERPDEITLLPKGTIRALMAVLIGTLAANIGALTPSTNWKVADYSGGMNLVAASYAIWNEVLGYLIFAALFNQFRRSKTYPWLGRYSYAAFLLHAPLSVAIEAALDSWRVNAIVKTAAVGTLNVCVSFATAWMVVQVPGVKKVI